MKCIVVYKISTGGGLQSLLGIVKSGFKDEKGIIINSDFFTSLLNGQTWSCSTSAMSSHCEVFFSPLGGATLQQSSH